MGTRGLFGFYYKGKYYVIYNHWDSYPSGLGQEIVDQIKNAIASGNFEQWKIALETIIVVDDQIPPTEDDIKALEKYTNLSVSMQNTSDWYCLLRNCQGSLQAVIDAGYLINSVDKDGVPFFEEYAYIVNYNTDCLDFYIGSKKKQSYCFEKLPDFSEVGEGSETDEDSEIDERQ